MKSLPEQVVPLLEVSLRLLADVDSRSHDVRFEHNVGMNIGKAIIYLIHAHFLIPVVLHVIPPLHSDYPSRPKSDSQISSYRPRYKGFMLIRGPIRKRDYHFSRDTPMSCKERSTPDRSAPIASNPAVVLETRITVVLRIHSLSHGGFKPPFFLTSIAYILRNMRSYNSYLLASPTILFFGFHHPVSARLSSIVRVEHMFDLPLPLEPLVIWQML